MVALPPTPVTVKQKKDLKYLLVLINYFLDSNMTLQRQLYKYPELETLGIEKVLCQSKTII